MGSGARGRLQSVPQRLSAAGLSRNHGGARFRRDVKYRDQQLARKGARLWSRFFCCAEAVTAVLQLPYSEIARDEWLFPFRGGSKSHLERFWPKRVNWRTARLLPRFPNLRLTKAAAAAFFFARSFPHESHFEYLEPSEDLGRRSVDRGRHHRQRAFAAGHHAGQRRHR